MSKKPIPTIAIEYAIATHFSVRENIVVPNVTWGWGLRYEADLVILRQSGFADEIEIKMSAGDLKADANKSHSHDSPRFKRLWFAVPEKLLKHIDAIPAKAGILACEWSPDFLRLNVKTIRPPQINKAARKITDAERLKLLHLAYTRLWSYKLDGLNRYWQHWHKNQNKQPQPANGQE